MIPSLPCPFLKMVFVNFLKNTKKCPFLFSFCFVLILYLERVFPIIPIASNPSKHCTTLDNCNFSHITVSFPSCNANVMLYQIKLWSISLLRDHQSFVRRPTMTVNGDQLKIRKHFKKPGSITIFLYFGTWKGSGKKIRKLGKILRNHTPEV